MTSADAVEPRPSWFAILFGASIAGTGIFMVLGFAAMAIFLPASKGLGLGASLMSMFLGAGVASYGIMVVKRALWKGPGPYDAFGGTLGWILAITGVAGSAMLLLACVFGAIASFFAEDPSKRGEGVGAAAFLVPLFGLMFLACWRALKRKLKAR